MDIRKADSKGRITGFEPGKLYGFDWDKGYFSKLVILAPTGEPIDVALEKSLKS